MAEYRLLEKEDFQQAIDLADKVFRKEGHVSMGIAFPQVFSSALHQSYGAFIDGKLVSFIGLVPSIVHIEKAEVQAYSIGAVCTEPDYRRRGFANALLEMIFEHVNRSGASVLFISGDLPIYIKQGCSYYGKMKQYVLNQGDIQVNDGYTIRELQQFDWFDLRRISQNRCIRYEQSIYELALLNESAGYASIFKNHHKVLIAEKNQEVRAFLVFGVPYDEQEKAESRVIEWGGEPGVIKSLVGKAFTYGIHSLIFNLPAYETELVQQLEPYEKAERLFPGTMKIINLEVLLKQLRPYLEGKVEISTVDENHKKLSYHDTSVQMKNEEVEELIYKGSKQADSYLQEIFPIPFPFPQGLNYV
ncbi:GNAT family N-acetyltransferase [Neobacillus muris]|uniref:GNAT family N-acetyltransferase n=1 Tax=Neobacillus muris TaxID=2941334 RepID=UPI00203CE4CE|nr:GNAT family N-acetyltransferase [Neobacillus muris]